MRVVLVMISLVAALTLVNTAAAKPNKAMQINATVAADGCGVTGLECGSGGGGSCLCFVAFWNFAGDTRITPALGALAFAGSYSDGYFCSDIGDDLSCLVPLTYTRSLTLTLTAPNGDQLVLAEDFASSTRPSLLSQGESPVRGAWTVDPQQSTGRLARYTGSGTYTLSYAGHDTYATFTIALTGSLTFE